MAANRRNNGSRPKPGPGKPNIVNPDSDPDELSNDDDDKDTDKTPDDKDNDDEDKDNDDDVSPNEKDSNDSENYDDNSPDESLELPDNLQPDPNKPIPGNWGVNCRDEYAIKHKLCFNELYRKLMQERCAATCPKDDCYDDRHDLCVAWAGNNFCTREMYTNMKTLCRKTCSMCTATTGF